MSEEVWREQDTTPSRIEAALRELLAERHHDEDAFVPARVLNLVVVVDGEFRGEVENRLERVGRYHPSRLVLCSRGAAAARRSTRGHRWPPRRPRARSRSAARASSSTSASAT